MNVFSWAILLDNGVIVFALSQPIISSLPAASSSTKTFHTTAYILFHLHKRIIPLCLSRDLQYLLPHHFLRLNRYLLIQQIFLNKSNPSLMNLISTMTHSPFLRLLHLLPFEAECYQCLRPQTQSRSISAIVANSKAYRKRQRTHSRIRRKEAASHKA